jgi:tetratricopeptide (TPR) repeat protein
VALVRAGAAAVLLARLSGPSAAAEGGTDPAAALDQALATAESSLQKGEYQAAEGHYRTALFEGWLLMGGLEEREGRIPEARAALQKASTFASEDRRGLQALASGHLQAGEAAQAAEILAGLAAKDARDVDSRLLLAKALAADGRVEEAVRKLDEASATAPDDPEHLFLLATEYLWLKKVDAAERLFAATVQARPMPLTRVLIGRAYRDAGEYDLARAELREALRQDPVIRHAHYYLGMVILADARTGKDRLEAAIEEFQEELKLAPQDPLANDQLGLALLEAERPAEARPAFETAVRVEARSLFVYHLGRCLLALDRPAEAATEARRALELAQEQGAGDSHLAEIHYQLGIILRKLGTAQEATTHLAEARRLTASGTTPSSGPGTAPGGPPGTASLLSDLPLSQRRELTRRVTADLARAYFNLGVLQAQSQGSAPAAERFARAAALFESAAELDPDFPKVQSSLGVAYFNARQPDKAIGPLGRALAADPENAGLRRMLAISWLNTEAWEKAAALLRDDPGRATDASLQSAYSLALVRSNRAAEAETVLAGLVAQRGDSAELSLLLGEAYAAQGKYDTAIESLQRALRLEADVAGANATLGVVYLKQGRLAEAERALRAELAAHPAAVQAQQSLAAVLEAQGRPAEAQALLEKLKANR